MPIDRDRARTAAAELVVEDLKAERPGISGRRHRTHETGHLEVTLPRHVTEVARPVKQIHFNLRRIRELQKENSVSRDRADRVRWNLAGQRVKAVENQPDIGVIGAADDFPGIAVVPDMLAPGQGLVADAQAALGGADAEFGEILGHAINATERFGMNGRAHQNKLRTELLHQVELAFNPVEGPGAQRLRQPLEITERLE